MQNIIESGDEYRPLTNSGAYSEAECTRSLMTAPRLDKHSWLVRCKYEKSWIGLPLILEYKEAALFQGDLNALRIKSLANNCILRARLH